MGWTEIRSVRGGRLLYRLPTRVVDGRYSLISPDGTIPEDDGANPVLVSPLGAGAFGCVVRARDRVEIDRALKFVRPEPGLYPASVSRLFTVGVDPAEADLVAISRRLKDEVLHANAQPFKHVVPIIDYGEGKDVDDRRFVYYVSAYIPGEHCDDHLGSWLNQVDFAENYVGPRLRDAFLDIVDDLLAALEELGDAGVSHLDIKPQNTMVMGTPRASGAAIAAGVPSRSRLYLIDLGAAVSQASADRPRVGLICTEYYFPLQLLGELDLKGSKVATDQLLKWGPRIDRYSVGRVLEELVLDRYRRGTKNLDKLERVPVARDEEIKEAKWHKVLGSDFDVLSAYIDRLMDLSEDGFRTAHEARAAFQSISRPSSRSMFASKLLTDRESNLRINVGGALVQVGPPLDRVVNHLAFQRLRRLNQLALISHIFPDATHTRFAHSLRVFDLAKRYVLALHKDARFRELFTQRDVDHVLAAALLHDIGQYPFSHSIEDLKKLGDLFGPPHLTQIEHDQDLAEMMVDLPDTEGTRIRDILESQRYEVADILYMIKKTEKKWDRPYAHNIGRDIITGGIDVDRVSYLLQDTTRTGVPFAGAIDTGQLAEALCIWKESGGPRRGVGLAIEEHGVSAVEAVLTAVYWMYRNVYWYHVNRGFMAATKEVMWRLVEDGQLTFSQYIKATLGQTDWDALVFLNDEFKKLNLRTTTEATRMHAPLESLVSRKRFGYKRVFSLGFRDGHPDGTLYNDLVGHILPDRIRELALNVSGALPKVAKTKTCDVLVDVPLKKRLRGDGSHRISSTPDSPTDAGTRPQIMVRQRQGFGPKLSSWVKLEEFSPLAVALSAVEDHSGRKVRVFFSNELIGRLPAEFLIQVEGEVRGSLAATVAGWLRV